jgi:hypothetical protein
MPFLLMVFHGRTFPITAVHALVLIDGGYTSTAVALQMYGLAHIGGQYQVN